MKNKVKLFLTLFRHDVKEHKYVSLFIYENHVETGGMHVYKSLSINNSISYDCGIDILSGKLYYKIYERQN